MSKIIFSILILLLFVSASTFAGTTGVIKGNVVDSVSRKPLPGTFIGTAKSQIGSYTDEDGNYVINIEPGTYTLHHINHEYRAKYYSDIKVESDSTIILNFELIFNPDWMKSQPHPRKPKHFPQIKCDAFLEGAFIPKEFTCDSLDISPELEIYYLSKETNSFALICDDPDAPGGTWVHWIIFNIPPDLTKIPFSVYRKLKPPLGIKSLPIQPVQGINDFGEIGYGGPCPPIGQEHRYFFKLYALDMVLEFDEAVIQKGITKDMLLNAMEGHILAESVLMGKYKR